MAGYFNPPEAGKPQKVSKGPGCRVHGAGYLIRTDDLPLQGGMCPFLPLRLLAAAMHGRLLHFALVAVLLLVPSVRIERTTYRLPYHFDFRRRALCSFVVWTIPWPWRCFRPPPSSLYTFPLRDWLGIGMADLAQL